MAIEKNAARKGTRWMFCGHVVVVDEVTAEHVIFHQERTLGRAEVATLRKFLDCARDPNSAEYDRLVEGLNFIVPSDSPDGLLLKLLRDAAIYQLERMHPATPVYVAPVYPPKPASVEDATLVAKEVEEAVEDYAVALPRCEPLPEDRPVECKRRFA